MKRTRFTMLWAPVLVLASAACAPRATVQTPPGFAVLDDQKEYVYRASSADGVVIAVRAEKNEPKGNLDFWSDALDRQLRREGYAPESAGHEGGASTPRPPTDVRTATGLPGRQTRYTRTENGRKYRFWLTVFVTESRVWVVEAGGDEDRFKGRIQEGIQKAIESLGVG